MRYLTVSFVFPGSNFYYRIYTKYKYGRKMASEMKNSIIDLKINLESLKDPNLNTLSLEELEAYINCKILSF